MMEISSNPEKTGQKKASLVLMLTSMLLLTACSRPENKDLIVVSQDSSGVLVAEQIPKEIVSGKAVADLVTDAVCEEGIFQDDAGNYYEYKVRIPALLSETDGAVALNRKIMEDFSDKAESVPVSIEQKKLCGNVFVSWSAVRYRDCLSIVVKDTGADGITDHHIYHYDISREREISQDELVEYAGYSEEQMKSEALRTMVMKFDELSESIPPEKKNLGNYYDRILPLRNKNIRKFRQSDLKLFYGEKGLSMITRFQDPLTGEQKEEILPIRHFEEKILPQKEVKSRFIHARLDKNHIYVSFDKTPEALYTLYGGLREMPSDDRIFKEEFEVNGTWSLYDDIQIRNIGPEYYPYLFLKTRPSESGKCRLEAVNLLDAAKYGIFSAVPMMGSSAFTEYRQETRNGRTRFLAEDEDGNEMDLGFWIHSAEHMMDQDIQEDCLLESEEMVHKLAPGVQYQSYLRIRFMDHGGFYLEEAVPELYYSMTWSGRVKCIGFSQEGTIYDYILYPKNGMEALSGCLLQSYEKDGNGEEVITMKILSGPELFDRPGEAVLFYKKSSE